MDPDKMSEKKKENLEKVFQQVEKEEGGAEQFPYLVRGAELCCTCGTHKRKINLPLCHGVYVAEKPMLHEEDCEAGDDKNIPAFGICQSEENPVNKNWAEKALDKVLNFLQGKEEEEGPKEIMLKTEDGKNVKGYACTPCIVGKWHDVYKSEKIARNGTDGSGEGDSLATLTTESFLVCSYGGIIEPMNCGQEEE